MIPLLFAEEDVCSGDGWSWRSEPLQTNICLLEALAGRGRTGTVQQPLLSLKKAALCVLVLVTRTAFVIGLGAHMVQIYEVAFGFFFFLKIVHFHNLRVSLGMSRVYICTGADHKAEKLWMVFKPNLVKKRMPSSKNVNFSYHVSCAINACDKSVGVSLSKWLWKFARPCQQQFPSAAESLGRVNAGVWDWDWGEQHARRTLFLP